MNKKQFAKNLKKLRLENNLTQEELANKLSVTDKSISKWESGKAIPRVEILKKIENLFNCDLTILINEKENRKINTYQYLVEYSTDTKSFKIRKMVRSIILTIIISILSIFLFIQIQKHYGTNINEYITINGYKAFTKENKKVIDKCDYILNNLNNSNFNLENRLSDVFYTKGEQDQYDDYYEYSDAEKLTEKEFLYNQITNLKKYSLYKQNIIDELWNNKKGEEEAEFSLSFIEKYPNFINDGIDDNLYNVFYSEYIYKYLSHYDKNMKENNIMQRRIRKSANFIFKEKDKFYEYNYSIMNLNLIHKDDVYASRYDRLYSIQNNLLLLLAANNSLLDDIIEVGEIHE